MLSKVKLFILTLLLCSCNRGALSVYNQYITPDTLPSYHVRSPDPRLECPTVGQRLTIRWDLKNQFHYYQKVWIDMKIRFTNKQEEELRITIDCPLGHTHYYLLNQEYYNACGIQSYKVEMYGDDQLITTWRHQLWVDLIEINDDEIEEDDE